MGAIYLLAITSFGTWQRAKASLRGEVVTLEPLPVGSKTHSPDEIITVSYMVSNFGRVPVAVYGGANDCSCQAITDLPLRLAPGEQNEFTIRLRLPNSAGFFRRRIYILTDHDDARRVEATFSCIVAKAAE